MESERLVIVVKDLARKNHFPDSFPSNPCKTSLSFGRWGLGELVLTLLWPTARNVFTPVAREPLHLFNLQL